MTTRSIASHMSGPRAALLAKTDLLLEAARDLVAQLEGGAVSGERDANAAFMRAAREFVCAERALRRRPQTGDTSSVASPNGRRNCDND
jgi:hypothetical protein